MSVTPAFQWGINEIGTLDEHNFRASLHLTLRSFTLTTWFYPACLAGRQVVIRLNQPDTPGWNLILEEGRLLAEYGSVEKALTRVEGPEINPDRWNFAALIADTARRTLCIANGQQKFSGAVESVSAANLHELIVGGYTDPAGGHYDHTFGRDQTGLVSEVRLFTRALTSGEIAELAEISGEAPTAQITAHGGREAPCNIHFSAGGPDGAYAAIWDFGDGASGIGHEVAHHYAHSGSYRVRLAAIGAGHQQAVSEMSLSLTGASSELQPVPVFVNGSEGYACYRIPAIIRTASGELLAFAEGRRDSCSDSTPVIHIVSKRSVDNGATWGQLQRVAQHGEQALMNPSPVVDTARGTGRIVLLYNAMTTNEWALARGEGLSLTFCIISEDHGATWSAPRDISAQIRGDHDWRIQRPTLGHAIQRADGRIIHASTITEGSASIFESQNVLIWSDDLGSTWHHAQPCPIAGLNEATAAVLADGTVLINSRAYIDGRPAGHRALTRAHFAADGTVDYGGTIYHPALVDSAVQASTLNIETAYGAAILFSNPAHPAARRRLTVRASFDEGITWPVAREIDGGPAAYSDLVLQADGIAGVLYERGNQGGIVYVRFALDWLAEILNSEGEER